jgi:transposase-like protein
MVLGMVQRGGKIRMLKSPEIVANKKTINEFIKTHVSDNCERIYTDEWLGYNSIKEVSAATHEKVEHAAKEYVRGDVHTNTIESAFGLFKRALVGSFHQVSTKHLDRYLDEFEFRYNNRKNAYLFRDTLTRLVSAKAMPYEKLTA